MKNTLLQVVSIIIIILACFILVIGVAYMMFQDIALEIIDDALMESGMEFSQEDIEVLRLVLPILGWIVIAVGVFQLIVGIVGVKQKSPVLAIVLGSISLAFEVFSIAGATAFFAILGIILYLLYIIGAVKLNNATKQQGGSGDRNQFRA